MPSSDEPTQRTIYCRECGTEITENDDICPECGSRQQTANRSVGDIEFLEQYSTLTWLGSAIVAVCTFPVGLLVPGYFAYRASQRTGIEQGRWEVWAVLLGTCSGSARSRLPVRRVRRSS